jgi:hypothetical protein
MSDDLGKSSDREVEKGSIGFILCKNHLRGM